MHVHARSGEGTTDDERQPLRTSRSTFSRRPHGRLPGDPGRRGVDLCRHRGGVGALCEPAGRTGRGARRPCRGAGGEISAGAHSLSRMPARGRRLSAAQPRVSGAGAGVLPRRRGSSTGGGAARIAERALGAVRAARRRRAADPRRARRRHAGRGEPGDARSLRHRRAEVRRPRRAALHLGYYRPAEGRDAHPRQPVLERAGAARGLGIPRGRRSPSHAAHLPYPAVRGVPHVAAQRLAHDLLPAVRRGRGPAGCCRGRRCSWACPPSTCACSGRPASGEAVRGRPPVRLRLGAAAGADPSRSSASGPDTPSSNATE